MCATELHNNPGEIMKLTFHGAAKTVTGSQHIIDVNGYRIMLDCGLFQGKRKKAFELNRKGARRSITS